MAQNARAPRVATAGLASTVGTTGCHQDTRQDHITEAIVRIDNSESIVAQVALGLMDVDILPSVIKILATARVHLQGVR